MDEYTWLVLQWCDGPFSWLVQINSLSLWHILGAYWVKMHRLKTASNMESEHRLHLTPETT